MLGSTAQYPPPTSGKGDIVELSSSDTEYRWYLNRIDILETVALEEKEELVQHSVRRSYLPGAIIASPGEEANFVYILQKGKVKVFGIARNGHKVIYWYMYPGEIFGLADFYGKGAREYFVEATTESCTIEIPKGVFESLLKRNPEVALQIIRAMGTRLLQSAEIIKSMVGDGVEQRIAMHLLKLSQFTGLQRSGGEIVIREKCTHQKIADSIGTSRQTVSEVLGIFRSQGLIKNVGRGRIALVDVPRLRDLAE